MQYRRKDWALLALGIAILLFAGALETALGSDRRADRVLEFIPESAVSRVDRNGNLFVRFIMEEHREVDGHVYTTGIPVMAFGDLAQKAASYPPGELIRAIARFSRLGDGRESYSIIAFIE